MKDETFEKGITVLQNFYGAVTVLDGDFLESLYFKALEHLTDEQFMFAVATCIKKNPRQYGYFPSADQLVEYAVGEYRPPGENWMAAIVAAGALPSTEMRIREEERTFTMEQRVKRRREYDKKMAELLDKMNLRKKIAPPVYDTGKVATKEDYEAAAKVVLDEMYQEQKLASQQAFKNRLTATVSGLEVSESDIPF